MLVCVSVCLSVCVHVSMQLLTIKSGTMFTVIYMFSVLTNSRHNVYCYLHALPVYWRHLHVYILLVPGTPSDMYVYRQEHMKGRSVQLLETAFGQ